MCGITGIFIFDNDKNKLNQVSKMTEAITHRGPDYGHSTVIDESVALGHRRLSIIDLSEAANQPMYDDKGDNSIIYNGEVYNFKEIRDDLVNEGHVFRTNSDTEVILKGYISYGTSIFEKLNGMFAIAIYDKKKKELIIARDRFGVKPLYYLKDKEKLLFGSEIKAIKSFIPQPQLSISNQGLAEYLWFGNPLGEKTIYNEIKEVKPGTFIRISQKRYSEHEYYNINQIVEREVSEEEAIKKIKEKLEKAVKRQLLSDVPVGIFLSGGIDSSCITAFASKHYEGELKTYSVGFDYDKGVNELPLAKKIAEHYNTKHYEVHISGDDIISVIEELVEAHDEPFGDAADIPLYLLTRKLKGEVKVVLQGDGGDEFFGGYSRYHTLSKVSRWRRVKHFLPILKLLRIKNTKYLRFVRFASAITQSKAYKRNALLLTMESEHIPPLRVLNAKWKKKLNKLNPFERYKEVYSNYSQNLSPVQQLFYTDAQIILKDTFFEKVDKSTMANSMEVRVPFIDYELTDYMLSLPAKLKTKNGEQKYLLKKALRGIVPDDVLDRKKMGFGVPYAYWLQTSLSDYFRNQISTKKVRSMLNVEEINNIFDEHLKNKGNHGFILWKVLILCVWLNRESNIEMKNSTFDIV